jgi:Domain of unknown function (DUF4349)
MSQRDLIAQLREARPTAPEELRERVRLVAAQAPPPHRRVTWKRAALVLVPAAAAVVAAVVAIPRGGERATVTTARAQGGVTLEKHLAPAHTAGTPSAPATAAGKHYLAGEAARNRVDALGAPAIPAPAGRTLRYETYLELRLRNAAAVSDATKRAVRIATSLGGYPAYVSVNARGAQGDAEIRLRIPRPHVQQAISRLSQLGTITGENVSIQDLQAGINETDRTIARLQKQLAELRAQTQTDDITRKIAAITRQIEGLQRAEANTVRQAHYATVELQLTTHKPAKTHPKHHGHGPLHGLGVAFRWIAIGLVYALALGAPLLAVLGLAWLAARTVRRRREDALLSRP